MTDRLFHLYGREINFRFQQCQIRFDIGFTSFRTTALPRDFIAGVIDLTFTWSGTIIIVVMVKPHRQVGDHQSNSRQFEGGQ